MIISFVELVEAQILLEFCLAPSPPEVRPPLWSVRCEQLHKLRLERLDRRLKEQRRDHRLKEQRRDRRFKKLLRRPRRGHVKHFGSRFIARFIIFTHRDCFDMAMPISEASLRDLVQARKALASIRHALLLLFAADNDAESKFLRATQLKICQGIALGLTNLFDLLRPSSIHVDLKPSNILLDGKAMPKLADFGDNSPCDVKFSAAASAKGGTEIKIGSHVIDVPKYLSVLRPLVQMVLFPRNKFDDTFACLKLLAPKSIFGMAKRLCSSSLHNVCEADLISARPESESPKAGNTGKSTSRRNDVTENESHHSDPDSCGAEHGIKGVEAKASAAWVVATAAPHHATGNRDLLSGFITEHDGQFVHAADRVPMKALARGAVVTDTMVLPDVWFVPGLTVNLVSVSQLAELNYSIGFGSGQCCIRSAANGKIVGKAHLQVRGLYELDFLKVPLAI